jgi:cobalt/nickel transport system ATP-binding protein
MDSLIQVCNLSYAYPDGVHALRGVNFSLKPGETVALLGANGSGKTTFLLHLVGLIRGEGEIRICGRTLGRDGSAFARQKIGLLFQDSDDQLFMPTVEEDVAFGPQNLGLNPSEVARRTSAALQAVAMESVRDRAPFHLSAGQKRRVALAGLLAMEPEILLLDEPATFLDPPSRVALVEILRALPQAKLIVTHDLSLARALADRVVFFRDGKIEGDGPPDEVIAAFDWDRGPDPAAIRRPGAHAGR